MLLLSQDIPNSMLDDINKAIEILKASGCSEIYLFGSLAKGDVLLTNFLIYLVNY